MSTNQEGTSVEELCRELEGVEAPGTDGGTEQSRSKEVVAEATEPLAVDGLFGFDEELVKESLDGLLLVLISLGDEGTHGKRLMNDLSDVFGVRLSPGTVYPRLHDLEDEGLLEVHELVRTKEYRIADEAKVRRRIGSVLEQHLALWAVFETALGDL